MASQDLAAATRRHYDSLIAALGAGYTDYRWRSNPVQRSHYRHTRYAVERLFHERLRRVEHVLEVGCGPGVWTDICLRHARKVSLLDISEEMLNLAKARYGNADEVVAYHCGDYAEIAPRLPADFDVVFSSRAIEYMSDKAAVVRESHRLLRAGGVLAIITKNPLWKDKRVSSAADKDGIHQDWIYWNDLEALFRRNGFEDVSAHPVAVGSYRAPFNNRAGILLCDFLHGLIRNSRMRESYDSLTESYLIIGSKR